METKISDQDLNEILHLAARVNTLINECLIRAREARIIASYLQVKLNISSTRLLTPADVQSLDAHLTEARCRLQSLSMTLDGENGLEQQMTSSEPSEMYQSSFDRLVEILDNVIP